MPREPWAKKGSPVGTDEPVVGPGCESGVTGGGGLQRCTANPVFTGVFEVAFSSGPAMSLNLF